jgi:hypothetical protein
MANSLPQPQPQPKPAPAGPRVPIGALQPFCLRCGSSRCRDMAAHVAGK